MCIHVLLLRSSKMQEALLLWTFVTSVLILSMWSRLNALAVKVLDNHSKWKRFLMMFSLVLYWSTGVYL